jgi:ATPase subunit of ABC transporter with duplicated ATPase domains
MDVDDEAASLRYASALAAYADAQQSCNTAFWGQQARFQIVMLELSGANLLLLDEH